MSCLGTEKMGTIQKTMEISDGWMGGGTLTFPSEKVSFFGFEAGEGQEKSTCTKKKGSKGGAVCQCVFLLGFLPALQLFFGIRWYGVAIREGPPAGSSEEGWKRAPLH